MRVVTSMAGMSRDKLSGFVRRITIRSMILLDGVGLYYVPRDAEGNPLSLDVDQIKMLVCPITGGNAGLPAGTPVLTNGEFQEVTIPYSGQLQELGREGGVYFHGYIANLDLLKTGVSRYKNPMNSSLSTNQIVNLISAPEA